MASISMLPTRPMTQNPLPGVQSVKRPHGGTGATRVWRRPLGKRGCAPLPSDGGAPASSHELTQQRTRGLAPRRDSPAAGQLAWDHRACLHQQRVALRVSECDNLGAFSGRTCGQAVPALRLWGDWPGKQLKCQCRGGSISPEVPVSIRPPPPQQPISSHQSCLVTLPQDRPALP